MKYYVLEEFGGMLIISISIDDMMKIYTNVRGKKSSPTS